MVDSPQRHGAWSDLFRVWRCWLFHAICYFSPASEIRIPNHPPCYRDRNGASHCSALAIPQRTTSHFRDQHNGEDKLVVSEQTPLLGLWFVDTSPRTGVLLACSLAADVCDFGWIEHYTRRFNPRCDVCLSVARTIQLWVLDGQANLRLDACGDLFQVCVIAPPHFRTFMGETEIRARYSTAFLASFHHHRCFTDHNNTASPCSPLSSSGASPSP